MKKINTKYLEKLTVAERNSFLKKLRKRVDFLDRVLVYVLNKRTKYSVNIGIIKTSLNQPTYVPERERDILKKITGYNKGPLSNESLERIYERLLDQSRATQKSESKNLDDGKKKSN